MYAVGGWLLVQIVTQVFPIFNVSALAQRIIVLVIVAGFPLALVLAWLFDVTPLGIVRTEALSAGARTTDESLAQHSADHRLNIVLGLLLVAALGYLGAEHLGWIGRNATRATIEATVDKSIAVLPLANESGDNEQQYFSDGLSEDMITALSQFQGLKVISRNSSFRFRESKEDAKTIGRALGVAHLLEGSVRRVGDEVRISAELVNVVDGSTLWSQHYDRPYSDLFKLQDEITAAVAEAMKTRLIVDAVASVQSDRPPSGSLDAYKAYQQGRFYAARNTGEDSRKAINFYKEAVRIDPRYAQAYAGLSRSWTFLGASDLGGAKLAAANAEAHAAAVRSVALAPDLASAHSALGWIKLLGDFNPKGAEAEFRHAVMLDSGDPALKTDLSASLDALGRVDEALVSAQEAIALDPLFEFGYVLLSQYQMALGRYDESDKTLHKAIDLYPDAVMNHALLTTVDIERNRPQAALEDAREEPDEFYRTFAVATASYASGDLVTADVELKRLIARYADNGAFQIAAVYAHRGEADKTFEWLEQAYRNRDAGIMLQLFTEPAILKFRKDPRFISLVNKFDLHTPGTDAPPVSSGLHL